MKLAISKRKIVLLSSICILLIIYILQLVIQGRNDGYTLKIKNTIDTIVIQKVNELPVTLVQNSGTWILTSGSNEPSEQNQIIPASVELVKAMTTYLQNVNVLGKVTNKSDEARYGFENSAVITVTASSSGKTLRTINLGKNSVTSQLAYAKVDNNNEVVLLSGNPRLIFDKTFQDLKAPIENTEDKTNPLSEQKK